MTVFPEVVVADSAIIISSSSRVSFADGSTFIAITFVGWSGRASFRQEVFSHRDCFESDRPLNGVGARMMLVFRYILVCSICC